MATIKSIQLKILEKVEQKYKGGVTKERLLRIFTDKDSNQDGFVTLVQFKEAIREGGGNAISDAEAEFLFDFWDTMAGQQEPQGAVECALCATDLLASQPSYNTGFNSGDELIKANKGGRGNLPSQQGGIFGGGSYEADANRENGTHVARAMPNQPLNAAAQQPPTGRPRGNQSSIEGGIFGEQNEAQKPVRSGNGGGNQSNKSSIEGGIFGHAQPAAPARQGRNSNQSSIPGGIFG